MGSGKTKKNEAFQIAPAAVVVTESAAELALLTPDKFAEHVPWEADDSGTAHQASMTAPNGNIVTMTVTEDGYWETLVTNVSGTHALGSGIAIPHTFATNMAAFHAHKYFNGNKVWLHPIGVPGENKPDTFIDAADPDGNPITATAVFTDAHGTTGSTVDWAVNVNGAAVTSGTSSGVPDATAAVQDVVTKIQTGWTKCPDCGEFANFADGHVCPEEEAPDPGPLTPAAGSDQVTWHAVSESDGGYQQVDGYVTVGDQQIDIAVKGYGDDYYWTVSGDDDSNMGSGKSLADAQEQAVLAAQSLIPSQPNPAPADPGDVDQQSGLQPVSITVPDMPGGSLKTGVPVFVDVETSGGPIMVGFIKDGPGVYRYQFRDLNAPPDQSDVFFTMTKGEESFDSFTSAKKAAVAHLKSGKITKCGVCGQFMATAGPHVCPKKNDDTATPAEHPAAEPDAVAADALPDPSSTVEPALASEIAQPKGSEISDASELLEYQADHAAEALTPIPQPGELTPGDGFGRHLLLGGGDLYDSAATVISYVDTKKPSMQRQVLFAEVTPDAEAKLMEALAAEGKLVPKQVTEDVDGRVQMDIDNGIYEDIVTRAKSINYHLKQQDELPEHTVTGIQQLQDKVTSLANSGTLTDAEQQMLAQYQASIDAMKPFTENWEKAKAEYAASGGTAKLPNQAEFTAVTQHTKTVMVPDTTQGGLAATVEPVSIVYGSLKNDGTSKWNGQMQNDAGSGYQYRIVMPDGYVAYYRPHTDPNGQPAPQVGMRGQLEIVAPPGVDDPQALVRSLSQLHLGSKPITQAEAEWSYLQANAFAAKITGKPQYKAAVEESRVLIDTYAEEIAAARIDEAMGLDAAGITEWSKQIRLEAEKASLAQRTTILRNGVAKALGYPDGNALISSGEYKPVPEVTRVGVKWRRFTHSKEQIATAWKGRKIGAALTGDHARILDMLRTGALASQSRRRRLGVVHTGMSEGADVNTGGSRTVFLRNHPKNGHPTFEWSNPEQLLTRTDWYAQSGDTYGKHAGSSHDPVASAAFHGGGNEIMMFDGIDLYGPDAPTRINAGPVCDEARAIVKARGITHVNGIPVDQWIM